LVAFETIQHAIETHPHSLFASLIPVFGAKGDPMEKTQDIGGAPLFCQGAVGWPKVWARWRAEGTSVFASQRAA